MTTPYEGISIEPTDFHVDPETEEVAAETETDIEAEHEPLVDHDEHEDDAASGKKSSRRKVARPTRLTAAQVRRVLSQAKVIKDQDQPVRNLLAATLGTGSSVEDLVVATLSAAKAPTDIITELLAVAAEEDSFQPVVLAHALISDRDNARRTWSILTALGKVSGGIPAKDIQAATVVAKAAKDLSLDDLAGLELVTELLG